MSSQQILLGINLTNAFCRATAASVKGEIVAEASVPSSLKTGTGRIAEQDAREWWRIASRAGREAIAESGAGGSEVIALAVCSPGQSFVPVGPTREPLRGAISSLDPRGEEEAAELADKLGTDRLFRITGKRPGVGHPLPKMMWLARHEPDVCAETDKFLMAHDYVGYRLVGEAVTDHSLASATLAHDVNTLDWSEEILNAARLSRQVLPEPRQAGTVLGRVIRESAEVFGIPAGTVLGVGGEARKCAALGAGIAEGKITVSLGTASAICAIVPAPVLDDRMRLPCFPFLVPGTWELEGMVGAAGGALAWLKNTLFVMDYTAIDSLAEESFEGTRNLFFYPYLRGSGSPLWRESDTGSFTGITFTTEAGDMARAVMEGVGYQIRWNVQTLQELGAEVNEVTLFGGGAMSPVWSRMIADILGRPVAVPSTAATAGIGACMLAGLACEVYSSVEEASVLVPESSVVEPDAVRSAEYDERFRRYVENADRFAIQPDG